MNEEQKDKNREFAELVGIPWHDEEFDVPTWYYDNEKKEWVHGIIESHNPDYSADPRLVLRELQRNGWFYDFVLWTLKEYVSLEQVSFWLDYYILDTTGLLRDKAIEWMKGENEGSN